MSSRASQPATDSLTTKITAFIQAVQPHLKTILAAAIAVLVVVLAVSAVQAHKEAQLKASFAALGKAETTDELDKVAATHKGSVVAQEAALRAARKLYADGEFDEAAKRFANIKANLTRELRPAALNGQAYALEAAGRLKEAGETHGEAAQSGRSPATRVDALCSAGRCAKGRGEFDEAATWYKQAQEEAGENSQLTERIGQLIKQLAYVRTASAVTTDEPAAAAAAPTEATSQTPPETAPDDASAKTE